MASAFEKAISDAANDTDGEEESSDSHSSFDVVGLLGEL